MKGGAIMDNRILFGIMCIIFNAVGVPCFMQGHIGRGVKRIILGIVSCGVIAIINEIKGIILGIRILEMSNEEYQAKKGTFDSGVPG